MQSVLLDKITFWCTFFNLAVIIYQVIYLILTIRWARREKIKFNILEQDIRLRQKHFMDGIESLKGRTVGHTVYLVWLVGQNVSTNSPINALIGCFRDQQAAHEYAGENEHYIQEIEVA